MKSLYERLSGIILFKFFPVIFIFRKRRNLFMLLFCVVIIFSSCFLNFYQTNTKPSTDAQTLQKLKAENKYFIIHFKNATKGVDTLTISGDSVYGKIIELPTLHSGHLNPVAGSVKNKVNSDYKSSVLMEVHLYTDEQFTDHPDFAASISSFNRVDVYEINKKATSQNHLRSTIAVIGGAVVAGVVVAAIISESSAKKSEETNCNCPQVFLDNNGQYDFQSGLYSGAVYSSLERMDYLPLQNLPNDAQDISLKIANAKNEEQFINTIQLLQVKHPADVKILLDRHGKIYSYKTTNAPIIAATNGDNDIKALLKNTDELYYSFDNAQNENGFSSVELKFQKPQDAAVANLVIHARNSYWGGVMHKEMLHLFGDTYQSWRNKQENEQPAVLEKWQTDQGLPLMVYIKTKAGWKFADYYQLAGNTATRDLMMHIDLKDIEGDVLEVKLETAFQFWDLDFAGIDYSENNEVQTKIIEPVLAMKSDSTDEKDILLQSDKEYVHLVNDEFISVKYTVEQPSTDQHSSYFLVSGGYYHSLENITGKANINELIKFRQKGYFDKFSREKFKEVQDAVARIKQMEEGK